MQWHPVPPRHLRNDLRCSDVCGKPRDAMQCIGHGIYARICYRMHMKRAALVPLSHWPAVASWYAIPPTSCISVASNTLLYTSTMATGAQSVFSQGAYDPAFSASLIG